MSFSNGNGTEQVSVSASSSEILPMELIERIWEYLDLKDRVNVQRVCKSWRDHSRTSTYIWKHMLYLRQHDTNNRADVCQDMRIISQIGKWTKMKFSSLAISLQSSTAEQIYASKKFIHLLPKMKVQHLVISSKTSEAFDSLLDMRQKNSIDIFENIPGLFCFPGSERQSCLDFLNARLERLSDGKEVQESDYPIIWRLLEKSLIKAKGIQDLALFKAISNCSKLRSLILDIDCKILSNFSQGMPISQCKLDILSIQNMNDVPAPFLKAKHHALKYNMVKKARVIDLVDYERIECKKMAVGILSAASQTLELLTVRLFTLALGEECELPNCKCSAEEVTRIIQFPNLFLLWINVENERKPSLKFECPNLKFLRTNSLQSLYFFAEIPSIETLFISGTQSMDSDSWDIFTQIAANQLHTLYIYSDCLSESQFFELFLQSEKFPHLQKIVVLASVNPEFRLKLDIFYNLAPKELYNVHKIDKLIWQCAKDDEYPGIHTRDYMREHFSPHFSCIKQESNETINEMEYSAEHMGEFVRCNLIDKMNHFQDFLQRKNRAWPFINTNRATPVDIHADSSSNARFTEETFTRPVSPCESFYFYNESEQDSDDYLSDF